MLFPEPSWNLPWNPKEWLLNSLFPLEMAVCGGPWRICMGVDEQSVGCDCGLDWPSAPILTHCAWSILEYFPIHTILGICLPVFPCIWVISFGDLDCGSDTQVAAYASSSFHRSLHEGCISSRSLQDKILAGTYMGLLHLGDDMIHPGFYPGRLPNRRLNMVE